MHSLELAGLMPQDREYQPCPTAQFPPLGWEAIAVQLAPPSADLQIVGTIWLALSGQAYKTFPLMPSSVLWLKVVNAVVAAFQPEPEVTVEGISV